MVLAVELGDTRGRRSVINAKLFRRLALLVPALKKVVPLVFGELASVNRAHLLLVVGGSVLMILGALAIGTAVASSRENLAQ